MIRTGSLEVTRLKREVLRRQGREDNGSRVKRRVNRKITRFSKLGRNEIAMAEKPFHPRVDIHSVDFTPMILRRAITFVGYVSIIFR